MFNYFNMGPLLNCYIEDAILIVNHPSGDIRLPLKKVGCLAKRHRIDDIENTVTRNIQVLWKIKDSDNFVHIGRTDGSANIVKDGYVWNAFWWDLFRLKVPEVPVGYALIQGDRHGVFIDPYDRKHLYCEGIRSYAILEEPMYDLPDEDDLSFMLAQALNYRSVSDPSDKWFIYGQGGAPNAGIAEMCVAPN